MGMRMPGSDTDRGASGRTTGRQRREPMRKQGGRAAIDEVNADELSARAAGDTAKCSLSRRCSVLPPSFVSAGASAGTRSWLPEAETGKRQHGIRLQAPVTPACALLRVSPLTASTTAPTTSRTPRPTPPGASSIPEKNARATPIMPIPAAVQRSATGDFHATFTTRPRPTPPSPEYPTPRPGELRRFARRSGRVPQQPGRTRRFRRR